MTRLDANGCELVEQTLAGDPGKRDALARMVQERVYPYLRRVTLDQHKAEDLTQDTLLAVLSSLGTMKSTDRFWPWVFTIASNLFREQIRSQTRHRTVPMSAIDESHLPASGEQQDGFGESSRRELAELMHQAMGRLAERYRMVLSLRFYEDMPYAEVAQAIGCTEFNARALFCRAKLALARELHKRGVARKAILPALLAFGATTLHPATAPAATVAVSSTAVAEGLFTVLFTAKTKVAVLVLLLMSAIGGWAFLHGRGSGASSAGIASPNRPAIGIGLSDAARTDGSPLYIHTVCHGRALGAKSGILPIFDIWFYFPEGVQGPRFKAYIPTDETDRKQVNWDIETADFNYHYIGDAEEMHLTNARAFCSEGHSSIMPTDSIEFCEFVQTMEGPMSHALVDKKGYTFQRDPQTGYVVSGMDTRPRAGTPLQSAVEYSPTMANHPFDFVPPSGMSVIDDRDAMHQRGWTYYRMVGQLGDQAITGVGQIPFTYTASRTRPQWIRLHIGDKYTLTDDGRQAVVQDPAGEVRLSMPGGSFLKGLSRPWEGFHTLDTIRRDAAAARCPYSRVPSEDPINIVRLQLNAEPTASAPPGGGVFTVDTGADLLLEARYWRTNDTQPVCELIFEYLQEVENAGDEFAPPQSAAQTPGQASSVPTPLWPVDLIALLGLG